MMSLGKMFAGHDEDAKIIRKTKVNKSTGPGILYGKRKRTVQQKM